jgi:hypothetical protein
MMRLRFWKKVLQDAELEIPMDRVQEIRQLSDAFISTQPGQHREAAWRLWTAIADIFPEVKEGDRWVLKFPTAFRAVVVDRAPKR